MNIFDQVELFYEIVEQFSLIDITEAECLTDLSKLKSKLTEVKTGFNKANQILLTVL